MSQSSATADDSQVVITQEAGITWHNTIATAPKPGYLKVELLTQLDRLPVSNLVVRFYRSDARGKGGEEMTPKEGLKSDEKGVARLDKVVEAGYYLCLVEGETREVIAPLGEKDSPEVILLPRGYLAVRVYYWDEPQPNMEVTFYECDPDGKKTDPPMGKVKTDYDGLARLPGEFKIGNYVCSLEKEGEASISTVERLDKPYELALPVGRSQVDVTYEGKGDPTLTAPEEPQLLAGYLSVQIVFENQAVDGRTVKFFTATSEGKKGDYLTEATTDVDGLAYPVAMFLPGNYFCEIDEGDVSISTVEDPKSAYVIELPLGRGHVGSEAEGANERLVSVKEDAGVVGGYLSVQLLFENEPLGGQAVTFYLTTDDGQRGALAAEALTDVDGLAVASALFLPGNYRCEIPGEGEFSMSTVEDPKSPYVIELPLGRSHVPAAADGPEVKLDAVREEQEVAGGYLSVRVLFENEPLEGRTVGFFLATDEGKRGALVSDATTDVDGLASLDAMVPFGNYLCDVEGEDVSIGTVETPASPYTINLPLGRAFVADAKLDGQVDKPVSVKEEQTPEGKFLAVRVVTNGQPAVELKVSFYAKLDSGGRGALLGEAISDREGIAGLETLVSPGSYLCSAGGVPELSVDATDDPNKPPAVERKSPESATKLN